MHNINWDDFRYVLAVCDAGSLSGAARTLNVNHATVLRRINTFEEQLGKTIFLRNHSGYSYDPNAGAIIDTLMEMQASAEKLQRVLISQSSGISGLVRLTSTDSICQTILPKAVNEICKKYSGIRIEIFSTNHRVNMFRPEADITIRPAEREPEGLYSKSAGKTQFRAFATQEFWDRYKTSNYQEWPWYGYDKMQERMPINHWMNENIPDSSIIARVDSFNVLSELAKNGSGIVFLPYYVGIASPGLMIDTSFELSFGAELWVASHHDLLKNPHIKVCHETLTSLLSNEQLQPEDSN